MKNISFTIFYLLTITGCSAGILSIGPEKEEIIQPQTTKTRIEQQLGNPVHTHTYSPPESIRTIRSNTTNLSIVSAYVKDEKGVNVLPNTQATQLLTYEYVGIIEKPHEVKNAWYSAELFFLPELVMTPKAIKSKYDDASTLHLIKVWYDKDDNALAYSWETCETGNSCKTPNKSINGDR